MKRVAESTIWRQVKLKEVAREITVGYVGPMAREYVEQGVPFLRSQNVQPFKLDLSSLKFISPEFHRKIRKSALFPGDVVIVRTGYPGTACVIPDHFPKLNCADLVIVRPSQEFIDGRYLAALFNSTWGQQTVAGRLVGVAQQHFNVTVAKEMTVRLPPLPTQRKIAAILSAYDDLIENNTRRIAILEDMAQAIYREWFVHFRFPGYEGIRMVESELGPVPEGWEVCRFSDVVRINPPINVDKEEETPYVEMAGLSTNSMVIESKETRTGRSGSKFQDGDTLFPRITPSVENGKGGFVQFLPDGKVGLGSTEFIVLRSIELCPEYVYLLSRTYDFRENAIKSMVGASGRQRVQNECFDNYWLAKPPEQILNMFSEIVSPSFSIIQVLTDKNANLRQTRDLLLPRLISGELDVSELEIETGG